MLHYYIVQRGLWVPVYLAACLTIFSGCGGKQMYRVGGKVTYKDGTIPTGSVAVVIFTPAENTTAEIRKGASGSIERDGSFQMVTRMPDDGVSRGDYAVTFRVLRDSPTSMISLVAPKYISPTSSPFKVTVDREISDLEYVIEKAEGAAAATALPENAGPGSGPGT
jgi:hypothetical protein